MLPPKSLGFGPPRLHRLVCWDSYFLLNNSPFISTDKKKKVSQIKLVSENSTHARAVWRAIVMYTSLSAKGNGGA